MGATYVWVLVAVLHLHDGLLKEHISVYGNELMCQAQRHSLQQIDHDKMYFCQKELLL